MKSRILSAFLVLIFSINVNAQKDTKSIALQKPRQYPYESIPKDPLNARIYTLENGLKVYMTVYKDAPRIQTYIAVKAGSKNDPADATGLAHYLEHMLFKGTNTFGSLDFAKEEPLINKIEDTYEIYRKTTDEKKRKDIYHQIDSLSGEAAKYAIAQEYDKMISAIGAKGTNAYTWVEQTVYVNDIPSNQIEKWLTIESERFRKPVLRLFHTELEAVYEEKNIGLDNDGRKVWEAIYAGLFQKHSYGTQTTIGTVEHLKNPSMREIRKYYDTYYVPNNMAICISGDFDPDRVIKMVDEKFGSKPSKEVPKFIPPVEAPITKPLVKEVFGPSASSLSFAYRFNGADSKDADMISLINKILYNERAGLIDLNLNQSQKVLRSYAYEILMKDYSAHIFSGEPKEGQTLEEVRDLILSQIEKVKKGEFSDWLLTAIINDMKVERIKNLETNNSRADEFVTSFILDIEWKQYIERIERLSKITKQDIVDFANKYYGDNYVIVYKRTGEDKDVVKVAKPQITPVSVNNEAASSFVKEIASAPVVDIQPVFIDYKKDIVQTDLRPGIKTLYLKNKENELFNLFYVLDMGTNHNKKLGMAVSYLPYLGTTKYKAAQIQEEFYKIGCSFDVFSSEDQVYVSLGGLNSNFDKALELFEHLLANALPDKEALGNLVSDELKNRTDAKLEKRSILWNAMYNYGVYGKKSPFTNIFTESELNALTPEDLIKTLKELTSYEHKILYYGPSNNEQLLVSLKKYHKAPDKIKLLLSEEKFPELPTEETKVFIVNFPMKQAEIILLTKEDDYSVENVPLITLFNDYFGGGMASVVFQEMRESKALAYSVFSQYRTPKQKDKAHYLVSYIGTQADKLPEAMIGMYELMNNMPKSEIKLETAKTAVLQKIRTERITKHNILFSYLKAQKLGVEKDIRADVYKKMPEFTLTDLTSFQETHLKNRNFTILILGEKANLDIKTLEKYGKVQELTLEEVFGY